MDPRKDGAQHLITARRRLDRRAVRPSKAGHGLRPKPRALSNTGVVTAIVLATFPVRLSKQMVVAASSQPVVVGGVEMRPDRLAYRFVLPFGQRVA